MTSITFRPDDSGLQTLQKENTATPAERTLSAVQAIARIRSIGAQGRSAAQAPAATPYSGPERRKGERRQGQQRVILDTRAHRERRRQPPSEADSNAGEIKLGIDVYG